MQQTNSNHSSIYECPNCGNAFSGKYCGTCGQKKIGRLTIKEVWEELLQAVFEADRSLLSFVWHSIVRPGYIAREYLEGKRKRFFSPFQFMLLITGVSIFFVSQMGLDEKLIQGISQAQGKSEEAQKFTRIFMQVTIQYQALFLILFIPFFSIAYRWIYRKQHLNFAESYLLIMVGMNLSNIVNSLLLYPLAYFYPDFDFISFSMLGFAGAFFLTFHQFSAPSSIWKSIFSSILVIAIGYCLFMLVFAVGVFGWLALKYFLLSKI